MTERLFAVPQHKQENVSLRLRRIEGQIRGIQRMVEDGRDCREIVNQIAAVKAALSGVNGMLMECYVRGCLDDPDCAHEQTAEDLIAMMQKATR